jgi:hypothetical protein
MDSPICVRSIDPVSLMAYSEKPTNMIYRYIQKYYRKFRCFDVDLHVIPFPLTQCLVCSADITSVAAYFVCKWCNIGFRRMVVINPQFQLHIWFVNFHTTWEKDQLSEVTTISFQAFEQKCAAYMIFKTLSSVRFRRRLAIKHQLEDRRLTPELIQMVNSYF